MRTHPGIFTISLDFELYWGMRDVVSEEGYRSNLEGTPEAVRAMLSLFEKYDIHATWAIVGFLFFPDRDTLMRHLPEPRPVYRNAQFDLYRYLIENRQLDKTSHFAPELIERIAETPHQEIATHTFSHYYCLEEGQDAETFRADIRQATETTKRETGRQIRSIVFPRNQYNPDYLEILANEGIHTFRGNEHHPVYDASDWQGRGLHRRLVKLLDTYVNLTGYHTCAPSDLKRVGGLLDIPSSRFLRPYSPLFFLLDGLKLRRVKAAMTHAAKEGEVYHLWWHPHNFGKDREKNLMFLEKILEHYRMLRERYGMRSLTMEEIEKEVGR